MCIYASIYSALILLIGLSHTPRGSYLSDLSMTQRNPLSLLSR